MNFDETVKAKTKESVLVYTKGMLHKGLSDLIEEKVSKQMFDFSGYILYQKTMSLTGMNDTKVCVRVKYPGTIIFESPSLFLVEGNLIKVPNKEIRYDKDTNVNDLLAEIITWIQTTESFFDLSL